MRFRNSVSHLRRPHRRGREPSRPRKVGRPLLLEGLEGRTLLSTLLWTNRELDDGFEVFGADADAARAIVVAAIADWEAVIEDFNYDDGSNTLSLHISAQDLDPDHPNTRGLTDISTILPQGAPVAANIDLDDDGGGGGWFFDPTPDDNAEFSHEPATRFAASGSIDGYDFYTTVVHEIGHAVGIASGQSLAITNFLSPAGEDPEGRELQLFTGVNGVTATLLEGIHTYEGEHPNDLMNDGQTLEQGTRRLISDLDGRILADAYGYAINLPSTLETFLFNYNTTTHQLTVNGDPEVVDDVITLGIEGANVVASVNDLEASFPKQSVESIQVRAWGGRDLIDVESTAEGIPVDIDLGRGTDAVNLCPTAGNLDSLGGEVTVDGGDGIDSLYLHDQDNPSSDDYTITDRSVDRLHMATVTFTSLNALTLNAGRGNSTFNVENALRGMVLTLNAGRGDDTVNLSPLTGPFGLGGGNLDDTGAQITVNGQEGTDGLVLFDRHNGDDNTFTVTDTAITRTIVEEGGLGPITYDYHDLEGVTINGGTGDTRFNIESIRLFTPLTVNAGSGDNTFLLSPTARDLGDIVGHVTIHAEGGTDALTLNDQDSLDAGFHYRVTDTTVRSELMLGTTYDDTLEGLTLNGGDGGRSFDVESTRPSTPVTLNGGDGDDMFTLSPTAGRLSDIRGDVTVNGRGGTGDSLILNDRNEAADYDYTITATTFDRTAFPLVTYRTIEGLTLYASSGNNVIDASSATVDTVLNGGIGGDVITGGSGDDILDGGPGEDTLDGGPGQDTLDGGLDADAWIDKGTGGADRFEFVTLAATSQLRAIRTKIGSSVIQEIDLFTFDASDTARLLTREGNDEVVMKIGAPLRGFEVDLGRGNDLATIVYSPIVSIPPPSDLPPSEIPPLPPILRTLKVDGGAGNDDVQILLGLLPPGDSFRMEVDLGDGNDSAGVTYDGDTDPIGPPRELQVSLLGGGGNDVLRADIRARLADRIFMDLDGGRGNDLIRVRYRESGTTTFPAQWLGLYVRGGAGNDDLTLLVDTSRPTTHRDLLVDGGPGVDHFIATTNVKVKNCERRGR